MKSGGFAVCLAATLFSLVSVVQARAADKADAYFGYSWATAMRLCPVLRPHHTIAST